MESLPETTNFNDLFDEALLNPSNTVQGTLPDGWDGVVRCLVTVNEGTGAVELDYPADRLVDAILRNLHDREWHVIRRYAERVKGLVRYVIRIRRRTAL